VLPRSKGMDEKKVIAFFSEAIERANASKQFKDAKIKLSIEINAFDNRVNILDGKTVVMTAHEANISNCCIELMKWLIIANVPIFKNMHISTDAGVIKIESKD
jgi:hypothetical protein